MPIHSICPKCQAVYNLADEQGGKKVRCRKCQGIFTVAGRTGPARPRGEEDDQIADHPGRVPPRRDRRDDPDDRPRRPQARKPGAVVLPWVLGGGVGGVLLLIILVVVAVAVWTRRPETAAAGPVARGAAPGAQNVANLPPIQPPREAGGPAEQPLAANGQLNPQVLSRVKKSTLHLRVTLPDNNVAEGSGFFGIQPGCILTNAHVVGMLEADSRKPKLIEATLNSGEPNERIMTAQVLGVDRDSDLAVLRVNEANLPPPLDVRSAATLHETELVYVFGFPLGAQLGKEVTVSSSSVTSLRKDNDGMITKVQVNGGMQPGNSGGPVVNTRGEVIGVSVMIIRGTQLNFAVPGDFVQYILAGRWSKTDTGLPFVSAGDGIGLPVTLTMIDPLHRIQGASLDVWTGIAGPGRPGGRQPARSAGDSEHQRFELSYRDGVARGEVTLPPLPAGKVYWLQPRWVNGAQETQWAAAHPYQVNSVPVERKSARLMLRQQQGVHSLTVNCVNKFELHLPGDRVLARAEQINAELEENVQAVDAQGASLVLAYTNFKTTGDDGRQVRPGRRPRVGGAALATEMTKLRLLLRQDPNGNLLENKVDSSRVPSPTTRSALEEMSRQIQHSLEVLSVPLPNKEVRPLQQWKAWRNVPIGTPGNFEAGAVDMTYTYLGRRRNQANREEAVLSLEGAVQGRQGAELSIGGQATGTAQIDLETGLVRSAKITVKVDLDTKFRIEDDDKVVELGVKAVGTLEVSLERSVP